MANSPQQDKRRPFRYDTRQRKRGFAKLDWALGQQSSVDLPRVGYIGKVWIAFDGTATFSAPGAFTTDNIYSILNRINVVVNGGTTTLYDTDGFCAASVNQQMMQQHNNPLDPFITQGGTNTGANRWRFGLEIPVALNTQEQLELGLFNLQAIDATLTINLTYASSYANIASNLTSLTGMFTIVYEYYDLVDVRFTAPPPPLVHQIRQQDTPILTDGAWVYYVPRGGTLLQLLHVVTLNNLNQTLAHGFVGQSDNMDSFKFELNENDTLYDIPAQVKALEQMKWHGLTPGSPLWNFLDSGVIGVGEGDFRDIIDSDILSTVKSTIVIKSGATLGTVAKVRTIRRTIAELA